MNYKKELLYWKYKRYKQKLIKFIYFKKYLKQFIIYT